MKNPLRYFCNSASDGELRCKLDAAHRSLQGLKGDPLATTGMWKIIRVLEREQQARGELYAVENRRQA